MNTMTNILKYPTIYLCFNKTVKQPVPSLRKRIIFTLSYCRKSTMALKTWITKINLFIIYKYVGCMQIIQKGKTRIIRYFTLIANK